MLLKFRGIESIEDATPWRGAEVRIPRAERVELESGEFFLSDLTGCEVGGAWDRDIVGSGHRLE
jgi:16S rRNA processing protein RimM